MSTSAASAIADLHSWLAEVEKYGVQRDVAAIGLAQSLTFLLWGLVCAALVASMGVAVARVQGRSNAVLNRTSVASHPLRPTAILGSLVLLAVVADITIAHWVIADFRIPTIAGARLVSAYGTIGLIFLSGVLGAMCWCGMSKWPTAHGQVTNGRLTRLLTAIAAVAFALAVYVFITVGGV
ncbi:MAG: hypothetical protein AB1714_12885 [Acidobacteriota bacterium]